MKKSKYGYLWVTLALFVLSLAGHWIFGWYAYVDEVREHGQPVLASGYFVEMMRDTLENWQSEFLQLIWQVAGLAILWCVGSPQSKDSEDRLEKKVDWLLAQSDEGTRVVAELDALYHRK